MSLPAAHMSSEQKLLLRAAPILDRLPAGPCVMVEVGVYMAQLGEMLLVRRPDLTWHGIDDWAPCEVRPFDYVATHDAHALLDADQQNDLAASAARRISRFAERAIIDRVSSPEAASLFADGSADLVFIDADHSERGCFEDCVAWWRVVKSRGWLGGHDYRNADPRFAFGVEAAVDRFVAEQGLGLELGGGTTWWVRKP